VVEITHRLGRTEQEKLACKPWRGMTVVNAITPARWP
jgi:hypothetical protein